ncbi:MAG: VOC family protein [Planctomycetaceae bacterium]|jgi:catechol 2,3-dioxygenase-like lactoylglutathione lyase family enzyme|nr:VOC family protein [Planctomycetaceae bacterium]MBT4011834.1 VOC family protein [Planctomycetaceae bacterium]MBT4725526.1 VOC family protein [Planctomycetaceae bacterium]MBT4847146.1 VOC family protein [Planctomycetaceae bacterium]MBT5125528.1 VOC family protein [Planctomycetaceae bacterium]
MDTKLNLVHPAADLCIVCSNFHASLEFYRDILGFEELLDIQIPTDVARGAHLAPTGFRQIRLTAGHTRIKLMEIANPPHPGNTDFKAGVRWLTFIINDLPNTVLRLKTRGVEFMADAVRAPDAAHVICAVDPDGLLIELVQVDP